MQPIRLACPGDAPLSQKLREGTRQAHRAVESLGFIRAFLRGVVDRDAYVQLLVDLQKVYDQLEELLSATGGGLQSLYPPELWRGRALLQDIAFFHADAPGPPPVPSRPALLYGDYLRHLGQTQPALLLAHAYTRYLGDLSGGQILRRIVARALAVRGPHGLAFYDFPTIPDIPAFKQQFRDRLDALPLGEEVQSCLVQEARKAFALNGAIYQELSGNSWHGLRNLLRSPRRAPD